MGSAKLPEKIAERSDDFWASSTQWVAGQYGNASAEDLRRALAKLHAANQKLEAENKRLKDGEEISKIRIAANKLKNQVKLLESNIEILKTEKAELRDKLVKISFPDPTINSNRSKKKSHPNSMVSIGYSHLKKIMEKKSPKMPTKSKSSKKAHRRSPPK